MLRLHNKSLAGAKAVTITTLKIAFKSSRISDETKAAVDTPWLVLGRGFLLLGKSAF